MNVSKTILIILFLLFLVLSFYIITGIDLSEPEQAAQRLVYQLAEFNRAVSKAARNFFINIRTSFQERFSR